MLGRDDQDPLFLQAKEAQASVLESFVGKSRYANHGQRVVEGQRLMQAASDIFLGWDRFTGLDGVVARLLPPPASRLEGLVGARSDGPPGHGRLRGDVRLDPGQGARALGDRIAIASYLGARDAFDRAIA